MMMGWVGSVESSGWTRVETKIGCALLAGHMCWRGWHSLSRRFTILDHHSAESRTISP